MLSVNGLNHRDQRLANGGNQFSLEPPDQGLCVGGGFVVEVTNSVLRVRSAGTGAPLTGVQDLNTFFRYPAAINRAVSPPAIGPQVIDPVCLYDAGVDRFVVAITTLGSLPDGTFTGKNTIDVAVSNTGDPTGTWTVYRVPAQNDGTDGTPNHGCTLDGTAPGPCFQDYPHVGADAHGVYVSTNEYDLFGPGYNAAQIFAFSKQQLAAHPASIRVTLVENTSVDGSPGFTVWPAISPPGEHSNERNGTEYFMSTIAGDGSETGNPTGTARRIGVWALTNTSHRARDLALAVPVSDRIALAAARLSLGHDPAEVRLARPCASGSGWRARPSPGPGRSAAASRRWHTGGRVATSRTTGAGCGSPFLLEPRSGRSPRPRAQVTFGTVRAAAGD